MARPAISIHSALWALELQPGAAAVEVRRAFHRLARRYHPDRNNEVGATEAFTAVTEAYRYLLAARCRGCGHPLGEAIDDARCPGHGRELDPPPEEEVEPSPAQPTRPMGRRRRPVRTDMRPPPLVEAMQHARPVRMAARRANPKQWRRPAIAAAAAFALGFGVLPLWRALRPAAPVDPSAEARRDAARAGGESSQPVGASSPRAESERGYPFESAQPLAAGRALAGRPEADSSDAPENPAAKARDPRPEWPVGVTLSDPPAGEDIATSLVELNPPRVERADVTPGDIDDLQGIDVAGISPGEEPVARRAALPETSPVLAEPPPAGPVDLGPVEAPEAPVRMPDLRRPAATPDWDRIVIDPDLVAAGRSREEPEAGDADTEGPMSDPLHGLIQPGVEADEAEQVEEVGDAAGSDTGGTAGDLPASEPPGTDDEP